MLQRAVSAVGGGGGVKLLWENPNHTVGFQPQTVSVGAYDNYIIESGFAQNSTIPSAVDTKYTTNKSYAYNPSTGAPGTSQITYRDLTISSGAINFSNGKLANSSAENTNYCIPWRIWGYND